MSNTSLLPWIKQLYVKAKSADFKWKHIYPNNMPCNGIEGIYTDMFFEKNGKYVYLKFSIEFMTRCDNKGIFHPEEEIKYYVLHQLEITDLDNTFQIPEPSDNFNFNDDLACLVNDYGHFRYVFDDVETAKSVVAHEILAIIYPYTYLLSDEEYNEWEDFIQSPNI
ncbi:MAG: hypothetical protein IJ274_06395 [Lachnospiraceae bacterium]|nr:hypothetical protein [Lachnospiraceae bacterium]